jgi:hypothetical protein
MASSSSNFINAARHNSGESVRYSIVTPLYNERENILALYKALGPEFLRH